MKWWESPGLLNLLSAAVLVAVFIVLMLVVFS